MTRTREGLRVFLEAVMAPAGLGLKPGSVGTAERRREGPSRSGFAFEFVYEHRKRLHGSACGPGFCTALPAGLAPWAEAEPGVGGRWACFLVPLRSP